ncbi:MAG: sigma-70 family RNA polymerase sigma factor [Pirellulaceae bacterium]|nr:sigma-70 family RNA polymerase sigma factor [Pirellulaceae bacterium]
MLQPPLTRPTLLIRLRDRQDLQAWKQFVDLYAPVVYSFCRKRGLQDADASDLTQEVLRALVTGVHRFDYNPETGTFRAWLFRIVRNKLHDFHCRQRREMAVRTEGQPEAICVNTSAVELQDWERQCQEQILALAAARVQESVGPLTWRAFQLTAIEGQSGKQAAKTLGMSVGAVYVAKGRVLMRLHKMVQSLQAEDS